jgi:NAD(P)-dependent dehydrogenase (short-subunit alcohol dehydrogenase family)
VRIEENTFLVAGGGSGLGDATAHMLAASGARVVVADLKGEAPEDGRFVETDVTDEGSVRAEEYADLVKHIIENEMLNREGPFERRHVPELLGVDDDPDGPDAPFGHLEGHDALGTAVP